MVSPRTAPGSPSPPGTTAALKEALRRDAARSHALRARLVMIVAAVCALVWLSTLFDTLRDRENTLALAERQHDNVASALAEQGARALQGTDLILQEAIQLAPPVRAGAQPDPALAERLRRDTHGVPQLRNLFLFDPARQLRVSSASSGLANTDLSDRSYFVEQRAHPALGLFVSEPFISRVTGEPTFVLSRRLPAPEGEFDGIAGAAVDVGYIRRFYQAIDLGPGSTIELLRADGLVLVSREHGELRAGDTSWQSAVAALGGNDTRHLTLELPQLGRTMLSLRRVPGFPAVVAVGRSEREILGAWRNKAWKNVGRTFIITALAALLLVAFLRQLTRHERLTAQLHQSQKLEALGTLAGGIAHDFNNVLGAVLGYGELALQHTPAGTAQRRYLDNIIIAANRARDLVARILAFSRPGVGSARPLALQKIISEVDSLTQASLPAGVTLEVSAPARPLVVLGDAAQLHQMLANLVTNAVQAMARGGRVLLCASETEIRTAQDCTVGHLQAGRYARIDIVDSGGGMNPAQVERIFEPFFTTKPIGTGTGLGLSLVHGIVLDHGAALEVNSEPGAGTTFSVYLPLTEGEPSQEPAPLPAPVGRGQTVLIVDDEESLVHLAEEVLATLGYEPVGCIGAQQALKVFRADPQRFDAVVTDAIMPEMSGTELVLELRRLRPELPCLLLSGYGGPDLQAEAQAAGVAVVLHKPLAAVELARSLAELLEVAPAARRRAL
jgi:signal transduction histidine kinase/ActR/RegA family two-component response regulator